MQANVPYSSLQQPQLNQDFQMYTPYPPQFNNQFIPPFPQQFNNQFQYQNQNFDFQQQQQYQAQFQLQQQEQQQVCEKPPDGPYPGISHKDYNEYNINQQREYQQFLGQVGNYHSKLIPAYQKLMYDFTKATPDYKMTNEEQNIMESYIADQQEKEMKIANEKIIQQVLKQEVEQAKEQPSNEPPKKERKKLSRGAKVFKVEQPTLPKFPNHPKFLDIVKFIENYNKFLDFYSPVADFTKFPDPDEWKKKKELERKQKEEDDRRRHEEKRKKQEQLQKQRLESTQQEEPNRLANLKEEKVNIEDLEIDTNTFIDPDESRQPVNIVFIGHVDAGKSTLCGRILIDCGEIDKEELRKFEQEAKENNRESWFLAYCMDINEEERAKGKTVECGKAQFQTPHKRFTLFDAPGHKNYVPNMIMGACQADLAGLIISAKIGEFESGFEKGGQTQEHAILAKSLGVQHLVVIVTKMDTVNWDKSRYDEIVNAVQKFIQESCKFENIFVIPIDALSGDNCSAIVDSSRASWYKGPYLMQLLDEIQLPIGDSKGPIRIPVLDKLRDQGLYIYGKMESGTIVDGLQVSIHPKKIPFQITSIYNSKDQRMKYAKAGENVKLKIKGLEDDDIQRGYMICNLQTQHVPISTELQVRLRVLELPEHKRIMSEGYTCVMHLHCLVEEIEISGVEAVFDENKKPFKQAFIKSQQEGIVKFLVKSQICLEKVDVISSLGRFALRDEGRTIAFGEVLKFKSNQPKKDTQQQQATF